MEYFSDTCYKNCQGEHQWQLQVLYEISSLLSDSPDQQEMFRCILDILAKKLDMFNGTIMLLSSDDDELVIEALKDTDKKNANHPTYKRGEGIVGQVLDSGEPIIIPRVADEPRFKGRIYDRASNLGILSFICVPVKLEKETVGTLSVDLTYKDMEYLENAQRFISIVASIIAHDVHNRRVFKMEREALEQENIKLKFALKDKFKPDNMIGTSNKMKGVFMRINQVAQADTTVLIRGESGTGKELVASAVHYSSHRADKPFIKVNCAAMNENLLESELFGHEKGAFTGANYQRLGRIEEAEGGTLFLDEIGDFSPAVQVKLLRVIQEKQYERVGNNKTLKADVRIITATNRDLEEAVKKDQFRQDLYYRINVFPIMLPPLRDRKNDILSLSNFFAEKYAKTMKKIIKRISTPAINMLIAYHWPGNVRELENCIEHAVLLSADGVIHGHDLPPTLQMPEAEGVDRKGSLKQRIEILERDYIVDSLKQNNGNISAAAREIGLTGRMVRYKISKMKIPYEKLFPGKKRKK